MDMKSIPYRVIGSGMDMSPYPIGYPITRPIFFFVQSIFKIKKKIKDVLTSNLCLAFFVHFTNLLINDTFW